jgi:hypothetical protein
MWKRGRQPPAIGAGTLAVVNINEISGSPDLSLHGITRNKSWGAITLKIREERHLPMKGFSWDRLLPHYMERPDMGWHGRRWPLGLMFNEQRGRRARLTFRRRHFRIYCFCFQARTSI